MTFDAYLDRLLLALGLLGGMYASGWAYALFRKWRNRHD